MNNLPRLPRRRPPWQRVSVAAARFIGVKTAQLVAGFALAFASLAVADTVTTSPTAHQLVAFGLIIGAGIAGWCAPPVRARRTGRRRNLSTDSQAHNLSNRGLSRRFRRG